MSIENPWPQTPERKREVPVLNFVESHPAEWKKIVKKATAILEQESADELLALHKHRSESEQHSYPNEFISIYNEDGWMHYLRNTYSHEFNMTTQRWSERILDEKAIDDLAQELASFLKERLSLDHEDPYQKAA